MKIFFGSSSKFKNVAQRIAESIEDERIEVHGWWEYDLFPAGATTIESIERIPEKTDAALLFLTPDDELIQRGEHSLAARDNVIFEAGFFISRFGRVRTAIARVGDVNIPTDLLGITYLPLQPNDNDDAIKENVRAVRRWALSLNPSSAAEQLCSFAVSALSRFEHLGRGVSRLRPPDENTSLVFPLTAYPFFLNELLKQEQLKLTAIEAVGRAQIASFKAMRAYAALGLRPFDHRSSHWYLWQYCPPEPKLLDDEKIRILKRTAENPGVRRYMCLEPPECLPDLLFRSIYSYADTFVGLNPKAALYFVVDPQVANTTNWMYLSIRGTWFRAERQSDDRGTSTVEIVKIDSEPTNPFAGHSVIDAQDFTSKYRTRYENKSDGE